MQKKLILIAVVCLVASCIFTPAYGQGKCTMETLAGTYVVYEKGASSFLDPTPNELAPMHFTGATAPFVNLAELNFTPYGEADGFYWIKIGTMDGGLDPIPVHISVFEMNENCTGKMRYDISLPGIPAATIEERFVVFDNGREFRSVPTLIENGMESLAWIGYGRRIDPPCDSQVKRGTYVMTCENLIAATSTMAVADSTVFNLEVAPDGSYTGRLYEKAGPVVVDTPVDGKFSVKQNCSFDHTLRVPEYFGDTIINSRGLLFNSGKEFYVLPMMGDPLETGFCQGKRVEP